MARLGRVLPPLGPAHHGYPALVSAAGLVIPDREMPGRIVSLVAGLTLIAVTYLLARRALPAWGALAAATLVALHPLLALSSALVMDRKPYLPFFARMPHALMPDDDYDSIIEYAKRTGVDYLVVEESVMWGMRRQFVPLMTDSVFRAREGRLQVVYGAGDGAMTGVAIFEVLRGQ